LLNKTEEEGSLQGVSICANAPNITHLLFVDDSLLILKVIEGNAHHLWHILQLYEECSGQMIYNDKSSVMFSKNTSVNARQEFMEILDMRQTQEHGKYLGGLGYRNTHFFNLIMLAR